jgi:hypothetical protein
MNIDFFLQYNSSKFTVKTWIDFDLKFSDQDCQVVFKPKIQIWVNSEEL